MDSAERRATGALWSIQGLGPVTLREIRERVGPLGDLLESPVSSWAPLVAWRPGMLERIASIGTLAAAADRLEQRCRAMGARILFAGDQAFPARLENIPKAPPLLFAFGPGAEAPPRRRLAIVGTRHLDTASLRRVTEVADEAARHGLGVISGAAVGVDQAAHAGALQAKGETWAFMGCGLDEIDFAQREITQAILAHGGTVFSDFPPGFRANTASFTLRNRLISGASDAVLVFRAPAKSGALHTADAALEQGRPLLATPGDPWNAVAAGSNRLLAKGVARPHLEIQDLLRAVGLEGSLSPAVATPLDFSELGHHAAQVLLELGKGPADFEALMGTLPGLSSGDLSAALVELEVFGAVVHKGGRRYEKR